MFSSSSFGIKMITYIFLFLQEEDDWKEFEQKEEIDYSGLRVQSMQIRYFFLPFSSLQGSHFIFLKTFFLYGVQLSRDLIYFC